MKKFYTLFIIFIGSVNYGNAQGFDQSFNTTGIVYPPYSEGTISAGEIAMNIIVQPDGKILLHGGNAQIFDNYYEKLTGTILKRYNADGTIDASFGDAGNIYIPPTSGVNNYYASCTLLPDGKILLAKYANDSQKLRLKRLMPDGSTDISFGNAGTIAITDIPYSVHPEMYKSIVAPGGKIYFLTRGLGPGSFGIGTIPRITRLNADYTLDLTFHGTGVFEPTITAQNSNYYGDEPGDMLLLEDNSLILVPKKWGNAILKLTATGEVDTSFGTAGFKVLPTNISKIIRVPNNKFLVSTYLHWQVTGTIARYNSDFTIDTSFGNNGTVEGSFRKAIVTQDNKILAIWDRNISPSDIDHQYVQVTRYNQNGSVDAMGQFVLGALGRTLAKDIRLQDDGKILVCGNYRVSNTSQALEYYNDAMYFMRIHPELGLGTLPLGVQDTENFSQATVYPNPFHDRVTVAYALSNPETVSFALYDLQGRLVQQIAANEPQSGAVQKEILFPQLSNGTYFLKISTASGITKTMQLLKN